jgi:hypothetical protein
MSDSNRNQSRATGHKLSWGRFYAPARLQVSAWLIGFVIGAVVGIVAGGGYLIPVCAFIGAGVTQFAAEAVWRVRAG